MSKRPSLASRRAWLAAAVVAAVAAGLMAAPTPPALGVSGAHFTLGGAPRFLVIVSYFDALRASDAVLEADFAWLRAHGLDGVRIFPNWWRCAAPRQCGGHPGADTLFEPGTGRIQPERLARLRQVLDRAGRHGLVVDLSLSRETVRTTPQSPPLEARAYADAVDALGAALAGTAPHVMVDLQNEVEHNPVFSTRGAEDAAAVARLAARVAKHGVPLLASTGEGDAERYGFCGAAGACPAGARPMDVLAVHDTRGPQWHDRTPAVVRAMRAIGDRRGVRPIYLQEPQAWQDERAPDRLERFLDAASRAKRAGAAAWTFHTRSAFVLRDGRSLRAQMDPDERRFIEAIRARLDSGR